MEINEHILKLSGKVTSLEPLKLSQNFRVIIEGSITSVTDSDNNDGQMNRTYKFEPVRVEAINHLGKSIKTKDPRSYSSKVRAWVYKHWESGEGTVGHEEYYDKFMRWLIKDLAFLLDRFDKENI